MIISKKGQGLSLNVIIVAALALIVLVVLVMVFVGRINVFEQGINEEGKAELASMRVTYGACHPPASVESTFGRDFSAAETTQEKEDARSSFKEQISRCKNWNDERAGCEDNDCVWS